VIGETVVQAPRIPLGKAFLEALAARTPSARALGPEQPIGYARIETSYDGGREWSKGVTVYLRQVPHTQRLKLIGLERDT
jgi:hypothetical protein